MNFSQWLENQDQLLAAIERVIRGFPVADTRQLYDIQWHAHHLGLELQHLVQYNQPKTLDQAQRTLATIKDLIQRLEDEPRDIRRGTGSGPRRQAVEDWFRQVERLWSDITA